MELLICVSVSVKKKHLSATTVYAISISFSSSRTPVDCGTELNVLNYMHSVKQSTTPTSFSKSINNITTDS